MARLAELHLMQGDIDAAVETAEVAVELAPTLARSHSVLGFAALANLDLSVASAAFQQAIDLEADNPLPRLGIGLLKIRRGHLSEGRRDLQMAAALNPGDALIRSYLGKAYFDERQDTLASESFSLAKALDPQDPTPWFYDAIRKQTVNRPVEALQDLEKAITLNDDRAVYRSRLLIDEDLAARTASLGRLYRDLGFEQVALLEGSKALGADPGDYSGHRFLADTYSALPRHEVARVSELLQSQLLGPISITPVPPRLAETNLFILERAGPDELAFNEFNPLFNRNRVALQVSGVAGTNSVLGNETTVSGIWNRLSFSVGQFHYDTDGFRENNQQDRDIRNAFVQAQLSAATSVQAEFRSEDGRSGDMTLLFHPENFSPDQKVKLESAVMRVGVRHVLNPRSQLIASFYRGSRNDSFSSSTDELGITGQLSSLSDTDSWTLEVRHLLRAGRWSLTSGFGQFRSNRQREETVDLQLPFAPFSLSRT